MGKRRLQKLVGTGTFLFFVLIILRQRPSSKRLLPVKFVMQTIFGGVEGRFLFVCFVVVGCDAGEERVKLACMLCRGVG